MTSATVNRAVEDSLAVRAAWLHYAGGMTQTDVARKLGISSVKAHRLINRASQSGVVKVTIDGDVAECFALAERLSGMYGLDFCEVVPDLFENGMPLRALGIAGAAFLRREIESPSNSVIGVAHGRTLAAVVDNMSRISARGTQFVSLLGGMTRNFAANPHEVIHRLAAKTGAVAYVMPLPFLANTAEDRKVLMAQRGVRDVCALAAAADLKFVGIGMAGPDASLVSSGMITHGELEEVRRQGGVGEILGHFFNHRGDCIETGLSKRTLSAGITGAAGARIVAVAGGSEKLKAIRSILKSGCLDGLITGERTAAALAEIKFREPQ